MKTCSCSVTRLALALGSASLALGTTSLLAADAGSSGMIVPPPALRTGLYFAADVGMNLADNLNGSGVSIEMNPGIRGDLILGYAIKLSDQLTLAPEVETGIIYNPLDSATYKRFSGAMSGYFIQVPLMANAVLNWHFSPHWVAYGGAGAGCDFSTLYISSVDGVGIGSTGSDTDFAWQGMVGLRYEFGNSEVGLGYKYLWVQPSGLQAVGNNAVLLSYTVHF